MVRSRALVLIMVSLIGTSTSAWAERNRPGRWHGTYTLTDRPGYKKSITLPLCDPSAEKILDRWRGTLVIKHADKAVTVNGEQWIYDGEYLSVNAAAHRPPDSSIKYRIDILFGGRSKTGIASLLLSDEDRRCATVLAFIGKWAEP